MAHIVNLDGDDDVTVDERPSRYERAGSAALAAGNSSLLPRHRLAEPPTALTLPTTENDTQDVEAPTIATHAHALVKSGQFVSPPPKSSASASAEMRVVVGGSAGDVLSPVTPVAPVIHVAKEAHVHDHDIPDFDSSDAVSVKSVGQVCTCRATVSAEKKNLHF